MIHTKRMSGEDAFDTESSRGEHINFDTRIYWWLEHSQTHVLAYLFLVEKKGKHLFWH